MWYYLIAIQVLANGHPMTSNLGEYRGKEACQAAAAAVQQQSHDMIKFVCVNRNS